MYRAEYAGTCSLIQCGGGRKGGADNSIKSDISFTGNLRGNENGHEHLQPLSMNDNSTPATINHLISSTSVLPYANLGTLTIQPSNTSDTSGKPSSFIPVPTPDTRGLTGMDCSGPQSEYQPPPRCGSGSLGVEPSIGSANLCTNDFSGKISSANTSLSPYLGPQEHP